LSFRGNAAVVVEMLVDPFIPVIFYIAGFRGGIGGVKFLEEGALVGCEG